MAPKIRAARAANAARTDMARTDSAAEAVRTDAARTDSAANAVHTFRTTRTRTARTTRALRAGAALLAVLGLAGVGACEVSLSASNSATTAPAGGSRIATAEATGDVSISVEASGPGASADGALDSAAAPTDSASGPGSAPGARVAPTAGSRDSATAGAGGSGGAGSGGSGGRAGSGAAASDCSWLDEMASSATLVAVDSDTYRADQINKTIRIQEDLTTLTVSGSNMTVYVNRVDNLVIDGANADVHVCSVDTVTVDSRAGNATVEWGGDVAPVVRDSGANTDVVPHRN